MLVIQVLTLSVLLGIFFEDLKSRTIHWILLPILAALFILLRWLNGQGLIEILQDLTKNLVFLGLLFVFVSVYFSIKFRRWVDITQEMIGWGDMLFVMAVAFCLSLLNFLLFYVAGLIFSLLTWICYKSISGNDDKYLPLAGLLSLALSIVLIVCWCYKINLTKDEWVMSLLIK